MFIEPSCLHALALQTEHRMSEKVGIVYTARKRGNRMKLAAFNPAASIHSRQE